MTYPFFSLAKSHRHKPIDFRIAMFRFGWKPLEITA
jgi:hypothetical protein